MKKIPTLYVRDSDTNLRYVRDEVHPDCQWVIDGEGAPTYKWDGTSVKIDEYGIMFKRREVKKGKPAPVGFTQEGDTDPNTGKRVGWVMVQPASPDDRWHTEGLGHLIAEQSDDEPWPANAAGTYELIGPKVQGNPHRVDEHMLIPHGQDPLYPVPTDFDKLHAWLHDPTADHGPTEDGFEGVVWHHPDGRMAKIKARDFPKESA